ncbi:uncharacterized protein LOC132730744 [Ruditapes philippinarum]|uniref:uncharacterized protein LOC132730744 n=1 Tax=Ruditapes philippinarum TaxID=129788 RepID=UPI00295BE1C1|nr:uncharacterized protein LOC132730744 [Ruditapes philippinarum]
MVEPEIQASSMSIDAQENEVTELQEADNLSTNENKQMDGEIEETNEDDIDDATSSDITLQLNEELQAGYKILTDLMSHAKRNANWPFMESVEVSAPDLFEVYKQRIEKPMWLKLMKQKFEEDQYTTITEFVSDFRLMLENCYRFNGPDHYISKRAQKMETMLEQKLALLPRDFREKTTIEATTDQKAEGSSGGFGLRRRPKSHVLHDSTYLLNQLREAEYQKKREYRIRQIMARRAEREALAQEIMDWEDNVLFEGQKETMMAMWELPQIGLFLFLCQAQLNIGEVMHFELERCFMMARESSTLQLIMTSLLSTPFQRLKIDKKNLMPYKVWEQKLRVKLQSWYKVYTDNDRDVEKTCLRLGIDEEFFHVVGTKNPLERKRYHELSFYRKVWIMKSLCDHCLHTQDSLRETIEIQPFEDQREYLLGTDNTGQRYIHFPQFCGADVRVYRQAPVKYPKIEIRPDPFDNKRKFPFVYKPPPMKKVKLKKKKRHSASKQSSPSKQTSENVSPMSSPMRQRPSRLRQAPKSVVPLQLLEDASVTESSSSCESEVEDQSAVEDQEPDGNSPARISTPTPEKDSDTNQQLDDQSVDRLSSGSDATLPYCDNSDSNSNISSRDISRDSSPYPSCSDLNLRFSSQIDRSSDVSQESSPCMSPADFGLRRSSRFDRSSDTSRDASPLIFDSDFGLRRSSRNRARLKNIPPLKATRNLSSFLFDENSASASNSSITGDNSLLEMKTSMFKDDSMSRRSSKSSELTEDSNDCDIHANKLFANSKTSEPDLNLSASFHGMLKKVNKDNKLENIPVPGGSNDDDDDDNDDDDKECGDNEAYDKKDANNEDETKKESLVTDEEMVETEKNICKEIDSVNNNNNINMLPEKLQDSLLVEENSSRETMDVKKHNTKDISDYGVDFDMSETAVDKDSDIDNEDVNEVITGIVDKGVTELMDHSEYVQVEISNKVTEKNDVDLPNELVTETNVSLINDTDGFINDSLGNATNNGIDKINTCEEMNMEVDPLRIVKENEESFENANVNNEKAKLKNEMDVMDEDSENSEKEDNKVELKSELSAQTNAEIGGNVRAEKEKGEVKDTSGKINGKIKTDFDSLKSENSKVNIKTETDDPETGDTTEGIEKDSQAADGDGKEKMEESEEEEEDEKLPDPKQFEMVADSVEEVRKLAEQFAEPEPIVIKRGKKSQIQKPPPRKKNIVILHERLQFLLKELEPWESKLQQASKRARLRLRKEMEDYILKPPEEKTDNWKSSDEETESGESDVEEEKKTEDDTKNKQKSTDDKASASNSRCSTPVKPSDEIDEIDISHRGRLRKRRIIPNNVEDQLAAKKPKPVKTENAQATPTTSQPVIVQSGKTQLVDYADIIRQLKNTGGNTPILIKTTQGGRTVLTSVLPVNSNNNTNSTTTSAPAVQTVRIVSPNSVAQQMAAGTIQPQALRIAVTGGGFLPATSKALQHPTIQNLLAGTVAGTKLLPKTSTAVSVTGTVLPTGQPTVLPPTPEKLNLQKLVLPNQTTPQKVVQSPVTTPRKIAPHTTASLASGKLKAKYYAANASTLPINVVEQLIATRGAKLSQGAYNQSILLIPMESEGQTRNVVSTSPVTLTKSQLSPAISPDDGKTVKPENPLSSGTSTVKTSPNTLILPKPQTGPVLSLGQGIPGLQIQQGFTSLPQRPQAFVPVSQINGLNVAKFMPWAVSAKSPTRYPTNETVKTLLEKCKPQKEKESVALEKGQPGVIPAMNEESTGVNVTNNQIHSLPDQQVTAVSHSVPKITPVTIFKNIANKSDSEQVKGVLVSAQQGPVALDTVKKEALVSAVKAQQCVVTSISAAKLNTLLLQTSAAGAKSIPSLIKLPSKAALDSALKAVVTSVNITLPTVNIKVPSPTSLPSISPRRNVTKTIQTMKSPIPVAPKVVTQSSGGQTLLSFADSHTASSSQIQTVSSSVQGSSASCNVVSVTQSQQVTGSHDQDGKRVITRLTPQYVLTPKGVMQMGFVNQSQLAGTSSSVSPIPVPSTIQSGNQTILIQNSAGQYQLIQQPSQVLQQTGQGTTLQPLSSPSAGQSQGQGQNLLQTVKPVVALNASGNPIILPTVKPNAQIAPSSSPPSIVLHKSTYYTQKTSPSLVNTVGLIGSPSVAGGTDLKTQAGGFVFQQPSTTVLHPQTPVHTQSGMISPLLGLQQGLVLQGGVQVASPLVNQLGMNILHPGVQTLQNATSMQASGAQTINLLQKAANAAPVMNINPLLLNASLTTTSAGMIRQQLNSPLTVAGGFQPNTNTNTSLARFGVNTIVKASTPVIRQEPRMQPGTVSAAHTVTTNQNGTGVISPMPQMIQMPGSSLVIPGIGGANQQFNLIGQFATTPNSAQKQLVFQYPSVTPTVTNINSQHSQTTASNVSSVSDDKKIAALKKLKAVMSRDGSQKVPKTDYVTNSVSVNQVTVGQKTGQSDYSTSSVSVNQVTVGQKTGQSDYSTNSVSVNQVTEGQKTGQSQQKLLLFSIGGQLVTGQGVPVSLSDGVLKVVPQGKVKINNQTLSPEQIKQTLAKINEAAAMTLNPVSQQQAQEKHPSDINAIPVKIVKEVKVVKDHKSNAGTCLSSLNTIEVVKVKDVKSNAGTSLSSLDYSYLHTTHKKDKIVTSLMNGNGNVVVKTQSCGNGQTGFVPQNLQTGFVPQNLQTGFASQSLQTGFVPQNLQTGLLVMNSDLVKVEHGQEMQVQGQSKDAQFGVKTMGYPSGYVVRQNAVKEEEKEEKPGFVNKNFDIGKLVVDKETKRFVIKTPVKNDLNGSGDATDNLINHNTDIDVKIKPETGNEDDENDEGKLVIDDGVSDKEAALNLLTLANQALGSTVVKMEKNDKS